VERVELLCMQVRTTHAHAAIVPAPALADRSERSPQDLRGHAVLNYLAVLKIAKKADKVTSLEKQPGRRFLRRLRKLPCELASSSATTTAERALAASSFGAALHDRRLFSLATPGGGGLSLSCAVCLEEMPEDRAVLSCGHSFCWVCAASCSTSGIRACPLCRASHSLERVDIEIGALLGAAAPLSSSSHSCYRYRTHCKHASFD